jgi:iron complex transport system substrate-binding protein
VLRPVIAAIAAALVLSSCASDADRSATADTSASPTPSAAGSAAPERIVSLSPTATETLFAIGAGDQVVAVDDYSNYPADAPKTDLSATDPSVEAIVGYEPDLVVVANDGDLVDDLEKLDIETVIEPAAVDLDEAYEQIIDLGRHSGHVDEAKTLTESMKDEIEELVDSVPERAEPLSVYHELDPTLYSATSKSFIGQVYADLGLTNVADAADPSGASGGYPQLSAEHLVESDPDLVFLADTKCCAQDASTFGSRPGFAGLHAVETDQVVGLDDDIASRWGPRLVDLYRTIAEQLRTVPAA